MATCHFDKDYIFTVCPVAECPYHYNRCKDFVAFSSITTQCMFIDVPDTVLVQHEASPWTALSKMDKLATGVNIRMIRRLLDFVMLSAKTAYYVINEVPNKLGCSTCGSTNCHGGKECTDRRIWVDKVALDKLGCTPTQMVRTNIWNLLSENKLDINDAVLIRTGKKLEEAATCK